MNNKLIDIGNHLSCSCNAHIIDTKQNKKNKKKNQKKNPKVRFDYGYFIASFFFASILIAVNNS